MEAKAIAKFQRYGRTKVSQILDQIRGKDVETAEQIIALLPRRAGVMVGKTVHSAAANLNVMAGKKLDMSKVWVKTCFADDGPMKHLKRVQPGPQGRAMPFRRKVCHVTIVVSDEKSKR